MKTQEKILIGGLGLLAGYLFYKMKSAPRVGMVFKQFMLKLQGMKKAQEFTIYPYTGGDTVTLQSDTRIMQLNLKTGNAILSKAHSSGSYFHHLNTFAGAYLVAVPPMDVVKIQEYLWNNSGVQKDGGLMIENKELFSE